MSTWIEITDENDIEIDDSDINILYSGDENGNNYIVVKKDIIVKLLKKSRKFVFINTNSCWQGFKR